MQCIPNRSPHTTLARGAFQSGEQLAVGGAADGAGLTRVAPFHDEATLTYMPGELVTCRASPPAPDPATQLTAIASRAHRELVAHDRPGEHRPPPRHPGRCAARLRLAVDNFIGEGMPGHSKLLPATHSNLRLTSPGQLSSRSRTRHRRRRATLGLVGGDSARVGLAAH